MAENDKGLLDWAAELDDHMRDGVAAVASGDTGRMVSVQKALRRFIEQSPDYADALDHQANLAILDIDLNNSTQAVTDLRSRREEIARLAKSLDGIARESNRDASVLRLELVRSAVDATTKSVMTLKAVRDTLKASGAEAALAEQIQAAVVAIQDIRSKIERV